MFNFSSLTNSDGSKLSEHDEVTLLVAQLQNILKPFMLRRCKKDVVKDLPLKKESVLLPSHSATTWCSLAPAQIRLDCSAYGATEGTNRRRRKVSISLASLSLLGPLSLTDNLAFRRGELRHIFNFGNPSKAKQKEMVDLAALGNSGRGKRRLANRNYAEKRDADDDDQFETELIDLTVEEDRRKEKEQISKLTAKPTGAFFSFLLVSSCSF